MIDEKSGGSLSPEELNRVRALLDQLALGRFGRTAVSLDEMKEIYQMADQVITDFEKAALKWKK